MSTLSLKMTPDVREAFVRLDEDVQRLHELWMLHKQLYLTNERRVELLNRTAPRCFYYLQQVLLDEVILGIFRLTDQAQYGKSEDLVLETLRRHLDPSAHSTLIVDLDARMKNLLSIVSPFREIRNKRIGHRDLKVATYAISLPDLTANDVERVLAAIRDLLNMVQMYFDSRSTGYGLMSQAGETLIDVLKQAVELQRLEGAGEVAYDWRDRGEFREA